MRFIIILFAFTWIPIFELRATIPLGILAGSIDLPLGLTLEGMGLHWFLVAVVCIISNTLLGVVLYPLLNRLLSLMESVPHFSKYWTQYVACTQKAIHPYVEKWGILGLAIFIGIPLPGSGVYSGALGAFLLGMSYRRFLIANIVGVLMAGAIVTGATITGIKIFNLF